MNNSSNTVSRATSTPGSNHSLGHMLFNLSSHDQQFISLSPSSTLNTNSHPTHAIDPNAPLLLQLDKAKLPQSAPSAKLQDAASRLHNENPQFSHFLHVPVSASTSTSLEHFPWPDGAASTEKPSAENILMLQKKQDSNAGVAPANTNAQTLRPMGMLPVQANTPTSTPFTAEPELALKHTPDQLSLDNGESQKQAEGVQPHHHHPQLTLGFEKAVDLPPSNMKHRERQVMITDPVAPGDIHDQADEAACAGNRWPRQETVALLKIRADMDAVFRDTGVKRPLWDEVSRKLRELGYERSAKKCKEKFENVNKYYKRTKEGKVGRQVGKNYRFFTQLEALHSADHSSSNMASSTPIPPTITTTAAAVTTDPIILKLQATSAEASPLLPAGSVLAGNPPSDNRMGIETLVFHASSAASQPASQLLGANLTYCPPHLDGNAGTALCSPSQSSDDDDEGVDDDNIEDDDDDNVANKDDDTEHEKPKPAQPSFPHGPSHALPPTDQSKKRKRKSSTSMVAFFEGLLKRVMDKQEQMHQMFLQAMEKRESDRMIREEAWRRQEMARLSKEHDLRVQERRSAVARDAALIAFLQKVTGQTVDLPTVSTSTSVPIAAQPVQSALPLLHQEIVLHRYEDHDASDPSSKRWLKPEVLHLIELHRSLQAKFTEAGPKGPLWEEIANGMAKMGYANRTAKRCKEKWENINKYFKRTKESSKKRPDNAKTCPYFEELDALYRKGSASSNNGNQLSYKPSIEHGQDENAAQQASLSGRDGDLDHASSLQMQPTNLPMEHATVSDASNASGTDPNNNRSTTVGDDAMRNMSSGIEILRSTGTMQLSMDAFHKLNAASTSEQTALRGRFSAELGLGTQEQSSSLSIFRHEPENQAGFEKLNFTGRGEHMESSITQGELQSGTLQESKPSALAPLPNSTSFMATMLQKLTSNDTTSANNNPQDQ